MAIRARISAEVMPAAFALASARDLVVSLGMAGQTWDEMTDRHIAAIKTAPVQEVPHR